MEKRYSIAIIDSGVNINNEYINSSYITNLDLEGEHFLEVENEHGTDVANVVFRETIDANILSIKILNDSKVGLVEDLYVAIKMCIDLGIPIINLSLGCSSITSNYHNKLEKIINIIQYAVSRGIIFIAAYDNKKLHSFPARLPCVIGVDIFSRKKCPFVALDSNNKDIIFNHNYVAVQKESVQILKGNSYLAPIITGLFHEYSKCFEANANDFFDYLSKKWNCKNQKNYWITDFVDIKKHYNINNLLYIGKKNSKIKEDLVDFFSSICKVYCVDGLEDYYMSLNEISFDCILIGELSLDDNVQINNSKQKVKENLYLSGCDIIMVTHVLSLWDRIKYFELTGFKAVSLYI